MSNYTKGEWKYTRPQVGTASGVICLMVEPHYMPDCGDRTWYNGQVKVMEANAHLIAASPRMAELLVRLLNISFDTEDENYEELRPILEDANTIIHKSLVEKK